MVEYMREDDLTSQIGVAVHCERLYVRVATDWKQRRRIIGLKGPRVM